MSKTILLIIFGMNTGIKGGNPNLMGIFQLLDPGFTIVSFLPKILGRNQDFTKSSVWEKSLFKLPAEKGFREKF